MTVARVWGEATAFLRRIGRPWAIDAFVLIAIAGVFFGIISVGAEWTGRARPAIDIDLSLRALPVYTFYSLTRGVLAYVLSLIFTLVYGYWAAKDRLSDRVLVPLLDILQSIPVLGFMPGLVLALVTLFPHSNLGLELASVIMIFTGQAWNMTFSFYHSLRSVPADQQEAATLYRFTWWQRLKWVELPFSAIGLVWNSMMSMAGGWFFLMITETFVLGSRDFRLPGIGSYMSVAVARGDVRAMVAAVVAMVVMIVALDQFLWRPVVVWSQKFRIEESASEDVARSWFIEVLRQSDVVDWFRSVSDRVRARIAARPRRPRRPAVKSDANGSGLLSVFAFGLLVAGFAWGGWELLMVLLALPGNEWLPIIGSAFLTLGRVLLATVIGTLWTIPVGLWIGLSPRLSRVLQPVVQVVASFPAPMLFPAVIAVLHFAGVSLGWGSVVLMLLGTQWYILFNVIAGAMAVPADLREMTSTYRLTTMLRLRNLYLPAVFPYLVTGWVTAAGGAWNASIVAEYVTFKGSVLMANGLGARISRAAEHADFAHLAASVTVMAVMVVLFNRAVWKRLYVIAEEKFSLSGVR